MLLLVSRQGVQKRTYPQTHSNGDGYTDFMISPTSSNLPLSGSPTGTRVYTNASVPSVAHKEPHFRDIERPKFWNLCMGFGAAIEGRNIGNSDLILKTPQIGPRVSTTKTSTVLPFAPTYGKAKARGTMSLKRPRDHLRKRLP